MKPGSLYGSIVFSVNLLLLKNNHWCSRNNVNGAEAMRSGALFFIVCAKRTCRSGLSLRQTMQNATVSSRGVWRTVAVSVI